MALSTTSTKNTYTGTGAVATYAYTFKIFDPTDLVVQKENLVGTVVTLVYPTDYTITGTGISTGGTITLVAGNLTTGYTLLIRRVRPLTQTTSIKNESEYYAATHEKAFDKLTMVDQQQQEQLDRGLKLSPFSSGIDTTLPAVLIPNSTVVISADGLGFALGPTPDQLAQATTDSAAAAAAAAAAEAAAAAAALTLKPGGVAGAVLAKIDATDYNTEWHDYSYSGFSSRFSAAFTSTSLDDTLSKILAITYAGPLISLSAAGSGTVREKGTAVTSVLLTGTTTKRSNAIVAVRFYKDAVLVNTVSSPTAGGGAETYTWTGSFTDNVTFSAQVDDASGGGGPTTSSSSANFTFVYPYYYGAGVAGKTAAQVAALTKSVIVSTLTKVVSFTASASDVFYFAYPASYGSLTSILDVNNFETLPDWTASTSNITGLDGNAVSYKIYAFNNPVTAGTYQYTFKR